MTDCFIRNWRAAAVAIFVAISAVSVSADTLRIGGTGVALGGMQVLSQAYMAAHPGTEIVVLPSLGSSGGVKALKAKAIDISLTSRPLKQKEDAPEISARLYARTALAVVTATEIEMEDISTSDLASIYSGETTHWPDGRQIRVVTRPKNESDIGTLRGLSDRMSVALDAAFDRQGLIIARTDQQNAAALQDTSGAIGLIAVGQIATEHLSLNVLSLDGVEPTVDPSYPIIKSLYIVTHSDSSALAREFVAFVFSEQAAALLRENDHAPAF